MLKCIVVYSLHLSSLKSNSEALSVTSEIVTALHVQCKIHRESKGKKKDKRETVHDILW